MSEADRFESLLRAMFELAAHREPLRACLCDLGEPMSVDTLSMLLALATLDPPAGGWRVCALQRAAGTTNASYQVQSLRERGFVSVSDGTRDRRSTVVMLEEKGRAFVAELRAVYG